MAETLDAEIVFRDDLESRSSSVKEFSADATLESRYHERLKQLYDLDPYEETVPAKGPTNDSESSCAKVPGDENNEAYDFRLFGKNYQFTQPPLLLNANGNSQKIILRSPSPANREPSFVRPCRPDEYYFTGVRKPEQAERFHQSAVSGEHVLKGLEKIWPGMQMPWRVITIATTRSSREADLLTSQRDIDARRKRKGKKRRVVIRKRSQAESAKELANQQKLAEMEAAWRKNRTRKNREKKVKKRQKNKLKKSSGVEDPA